MKPLGSARVLLVSLSERTSAKGRKYMSGWLGKASVVAFPGEPDKFGNETWDLFVSPAPPRQQPSTAGGPAQRWAWGDGPPAGDRAAAGPEFLYEGGAHARARENRR